MSALSGMNNSFTAVKSALSRVKSNKATEPFDRKGKKPCRENEEPANSSLINLGTSHKRKITGALSGEMRKLFLAMSGSTMEESDKEWCQVEKNDCFSEENDGSEKSKASASSSIDFESLIPALPEEGDEQGWEQISTVQFNEGRADDWFPAHKRFAIGEFPDDEAAFIFDIPEPRKHRFPYTKLFHAPTTQLELTLEPIAEEEESKEVKKVVEKPKEIEEPTVGKKEVEGPGDETKEAEEPKDRTKQPIIPFRSVSISSGSTGSSIENDSELEYRLE